VTLADGAVVVRELSHPPGHAQNPLTDAQLAAKFHGLVDPVLGRERAVEIQGRISDLESDRSPHEALQLLRR
jgi:2-methylcitrate dehydratase